MAVKTTDQKETLYERLETVARTNEGTSKWLGLVNGGSPHLDGGIEGNLPQETLLDDVLWQTARMVYEIKEIAATRGLDLARGFDCLTRALEGRLYQDDSAGDG